MSEDTAALIAKRRGWHKRFKPMIEESPATLKRLYFILTGFHNARFAETEAQANVIRRKVLEEARRMR